MSRRCLITYGASGENITHTLCLEHGSVQVDECYTLIQRDLKYTLLHFSKRVSRLIVSRLMLSLEQARGIRGACVFGYSVVSVGEEIKEHPGMAMIIEAIRKEAETLQCWVLTNDVRTYKRGLLYHYLPGFDIQEMTKMQLVQHVMELKELLQESKAKIVELESSVVEIHELRRANKRFKRRLDIQERIFIQGGRASELLPPSP